MKVIKKILYNYSTKNVIIQEPLNLSICFAKLHIFSAKMYINCKNCPLIYKCVKSVKVTKFFKFICT